MARQVGWFIFWDVSYFDRDCKAHIMSGQRVRFFFFGVLVRMYSSWKVTAFPNAIFVHAYVLWSRSAPFLFPVLKLPGASEKEPQNTQQTCLGVY